MNKFFDNIHYNFGFGCMRLPMNGEEVDLEQFTDMVDLFMEKGFNYFDTAAVYLNGQSEKALCSALTSRYPRESFVLTDKLSTWLFEKEVDIRPLFEKQLKSCGVDYFDFYLMHAQSEERLKKFKACRAYETAFELKKEGKIKHVGISFHDSAEALEHILNEYPQIEVVQIQFNYLDYKDPVVQSKKCYDVCVKYNKPVIVMEPVKGGSLAVLPKEAQKLISDASECTPSSYAIRFAAGFDQVMMVLSGMSDLQQVQDNLNTMSDYCRLNKEEIKMLDNIRGIFEKKKAIKCTGCHYCTDGCPMQIDIPRIFQIVNRAAIYEDESAKELYLKHIAKNTPASVCVECGQCEESCPQKLTIRQYLKDAAKQFES